MIVTSGQPGRHRLTGLLVVTVFIFALIAVGCTPVATPTDTDVTVEIIDGNNVVEKQIPIGSSVQTALDSSEIILGPLDQTDPPTFTLITAPISITITRIGEEYEVEEMVIPFERQTVRNESLPEGETLLIQPGENGLQQITYRRVLENGVQTSRSVFKVVNVIEARPEIIMVGVQTPFKPVEISGKFVYLSAGNAWLMEGTTANRKPIISTGDLDGRVFSLSPDGSWLLFSRKPDSSTVDINSLWAINLNMQDARPLDLKIKNIIHYADWDPDGGLAIYYSTVEPRSTAPGWQANNDLLWKSFTTNGTVEKTDTIIETNSGGIYGWWGTQYTWSPDGSKLAYTRPDSIGLVNFEDGTTESLVNLIPFQTSSDWSWVPGITWSGDSRFLYLVTHSPTSGITNSETSPIFNLAVYLLESERLLDLIPQVGMFAYPVSSASDQENPTSIAFLQAISPEQSQNSRYRLAIMDQDGSNFHVIFPPEGSVGIEPQQVVWSSSQNDPEYNWLAFINQGNIWLINSESSKTQQITGDGLISRLDWK